MSDFLLELRCEEIPARMQAGARAALKLAFGKALAEAGIFGIETFEYSTPRRLALIARDLPDATAAVSEELKGPRVGAPPQALEGFLRKTGLSEDQLTERDGVLYAVTEKPGRATRGVLAEAIPAIIRAFPWPKSQRWGAASLRSESLRWVRPLSGIVAILGEDLIDCEIGGITSGYATRGHRFHAPGEITIGGAHDYAEKLRLAHVIVDHNERQDLIRTKAKAAAEAAGLVLIEDEGLVIENAGLTEWPVPLLGRFDPAFLDVPPEVIQLTARTNQKYFVCNDHAGKLANAFVCTANVVASDGGAEIVNGNRKVLAARLSDARFFWEQDRKVPLAEQAQKLSRITFHEKLGTVADKVERVAKLARWLVEEGIILPETGRGTAPAGRGGGAQAGFPDAAGQNPQENPPVPLHHPADGPPPRAGEELSLADQAELAARLCKADLVTEMVGEFPELQGLMGGYYARAEGLPDAVADAIRDHYKPVGQGDDVPTAPVTVAVSLADKLDTLVGFFANEFYPTGSKDPYALRRSALGLIALITENRLKLELDDDISDLIGQFFKPIPDPSRPKATVLLDLDALKRDPNVRIEHGLARTFVLRNDEFLFSFAGNFASLDEIEERIEAVWDGYDKLLDFLQERVRVALVDQGNRYDIVAASQPGSWSVQHVGRRSLDYNFVRLLARVHALQAFIGTEDGTNLLAGYKRAANILKKEDYEPISVRVERSRDTESGISTSLDANGEGDVEGAIQLSYTPEKAEKVLIDALDQAGPRAAAAVTQEDFAGAMAALASLRGPIDQFFEDVTVNDADPAKRLYRLGLLARFRAAVHGVADFSRIEG